MKPFATIIASLLAVGLPLAASAQSSSASDLAYCNAMSDIYARYIGRDEITSHYRRAGNAEGYAAVAQCHEGKAAAAIPVLERELRNNKFTLPARG